ncbi:MAG: nuclear transport factor 2 family protein [Candidatus Cybelea sp.]
MLASLGLLALLGTPTRTSAGPNDDLSQLRMLESRFATAMNNKDLDAVMAAYAPEKSLFVFDVVGPPSVHFGWDQYREAFKQMFAAISGPLRLTITDLDIEIGGDLGYSRSLQRVSGIRTKDRKPFDYTVRVTDVYRKIGGKWLIVQEHLSLPIDRSTFTPMLHLSLPGNQAHSN